MKRKKNTVNLGASSEYKRTREKSIKHDVESLDDAFLKKCVLGINLPLSSFEAINQIIKVAEYRCCLTSEFMVHLYGHLKNNAMLEKYFIETILDKYIKSKILSKSKVRETFYDKRLLEIYNEEMEDSSFDILKPKEFILNWNDVKFFNGYFRISPPRLGNIKFKSLDIQDSNSLPSFNHLLNYLQQRLPEIHCVAEANKLTVKTPIDLSVAVRYIKNMSEIPSLSPDRDGVDMKKNVNMFFCVKDFNDAQKMSEKYTKEELAKFKSQYLNYLVGKQMREYKIVPCNERVVHYNVSERTLESCFLFTIEASNPHRVILAVENLNTDRATMLFSFDKRYYEKALRSIYEFLRGNELNKRSNLRRWQSYGMSGFHVEYHAVNHRHTDEYSWYEVLRYRLRTM